MTVQSENSLNTPASTGSIAANTSSCVTKRHLDVELVELARRAVGAGVLVAEARRDLEVAVEARHHQQLLELLRRLRQRVELAGVNAARHQVVARAFGRARRQDRRLEFQEALLVSSGGGCCAMTFERRTTLRVNLVAAQIEEAVAQALLLGMSCVPDDLERQRLGRRQHFDRVDDDFDAARLAAPG